MKLLTATIKYLGILVVLVFFCGSFYWMGFVRGRDYLPTFRDIQQRLVDKGHDIKVDGIIGKQTLKAWDREICNQEAAKWDFMYAVKE